jgi:hypothetical protein
MYIHMSRLIFTMTINHQNIHVLLVPNTLNIGELSTGETINRGVPYTAVFGARFGFGLVTHENGSVYLYYDTYWVLGNGHFLFNPSI